MNKFKFFREKNNLTQKIVADNLKITPGAISQWEQGETFPKTELLPKIVALYKCTIEELLNDAEQHENFVMKSQEISSTSGSIDLQTTLFDDLN